MEKNKAMIWSCLTIHSLDHGEPLSRWIMTPQKRKPKGLLVLLPRPRRLWRGSRKLNGEWARQCPVGLGKRKLRSFLSCFRIISAGPKIQNRFHEFLLHFQKSRQMTEFKSYFEISWIHVSTKGSRDRYLCLDWLISRSNERDYSKDWALSKRRPARKIKLIGRLTHTCSVL